MGSGVIFYISHVFASPYTDNDAPDLSDLLKEPITQPRIFDVSSGIGVRGIDTDPMLRSYSEKIGEPLVGESVEEGVVPMPYLSLELGYFIKHPPQIHRTSALQLTAEFNLTGAFLIGDYHGDVENIRYPTDDYIARVNADWYEHLGHYWNLKTGARYSPIVFQEGRAGLVPYVGLNTGLSHMNHRVDVDIVMREDDPMVQMMSSRAALERRYGVHTESHSTIETRGTGLSLEYVFGATIDFGGQFFLLSLVYSGQN
jgi:hypothetical protein